MNSILDHPAVRQQVAALSVEAYHRLQGLGVIAEKTELLEGIVVKKMTKTPFHSFLTRRLYDTLATNLPQDHHLRKEEPLTLKSSEPEPDIAIVAGTIAAFRDQHPSTAKLVVEIAVTSVEIDRAKAKLFAEAGVPVYWLILAEERRVEIYEQPHQGRYQVTQLAGPGDWLETWYGTRFKVDALFA
jgi:Uma2 family endonuclease